MQDIQKPNFIRMCTEHLFEDQGPLEMAEVNNFKAKGRKKSIQIFKIKYGFDDKHGVQLTLYGCYPLF